MCGRAKKCEYGREGKTRIAKGGSSRVLQGEFPQMNRDVMKYPEARRWPGASGDSRTARRTGGGQPTIPCLDTVDRERINRWVIHLVQLVTRKIYHFSKKIVVARSRNGAGWHCGERAWGHLHPAPWLVCTGGKKLPSSVPIGLEADILRPRRLQEEPGRACCPYRGRFVQMLGLEWR